MGRVSHGVTEREQAILDRHERGMRSVEIAAELGLSNAYVRGVISRLSMENLGKGQELVIRQCTQQLAKAIERTGKVWA